jgi:hypothetical protein
MLQEKPRTFFRNCRQRFDEAAVTNSAERKHRQLGELKQLIRLGRKHGELVQRVFVLVARARIDAVHRYDDVVPMHPCRRRRGIKHRCISRGAGHNQSFGALLL